MYLLSITTIHVFLNATRPVLVTSVSALSFICFMILNVKKLRPNCEIKFVSLTDSQYLALHERICILELSYLRSAFRNAPTFGFASIIITLDGSKAHSIEKEVSFYSVVQLVNFVYSFSLSRKHIHYRELLVR